MVVNGAVDDVTNDDDDVVVNGGVDDISNDDDAVDTTYDDYDDSTDLHDDVADADGDNDGQLNIWTSNCLLF